METREYPEKEMQTDQAGEVQGNTRKRSVTERDRIYLESQ